MTEELTWERVRATFAKADDLAAQCAKLSMDLPDTFTGRAAEKLTEVDMMQRFLVEYLVLEIARLEALQTIAAMQQASKPRH